MVRFQYFESSLRFTEIHSVVSCGWLLHTLPELQIYYFIAFQVHSRCSLPPSLCQSAGLTMRDSPSRGGVIRRYRHLCTQNCKRIIEVNVASDLILLSDFCFQNAFAAKLPVQCACNRV